MVISCDEIHEFCTSHVAITDPWDWYVHLHLGDFYGKCTYTIHGSSGVKEMFEFFTNFQNHLYI